MPADAPPLTADPRRVWTRRLAWAGAGLALLWLVSWLALPPLLKWQLQKQAGAVLGRVVTVDAVDFTPWTLELTVTGLRVATADGQSAQFSLRTLYMDAELQSLLRLAPVLDALRIEAPRLALRHLGGGRLDVDDVLQRLQAAPPEPEPADPSPARFAFFNIELSEGSVTLVDDAVGRTHELGRVQLAIPFLSNLASRREVVTEPRLAFELNGNAFESSASTTPFAQDRRTRARMAIPVLDLAPYLPYWPRSWPVRLESGAVHADLTADFELGDAPVVAVSGRVAVSGLRLSDSSRPDALQPLLSWDRLELDIERAEPLRQVLRGLAARHPNLRVVDPTAFFCGEAECPATRDGYALFWDDDHVSSTAARAFGEDVLAHPARYTLAPVPTDPPNPPGPRATE